MDKTSSAISDDDGDIQIEVDSIDNAVNEPVTFIKMDIEGAEYQALFIWRCGNGVLCSVRDSK